MKKIILISILFIILLFSCDVFVKLNSFEFESSQNYNSGNLSLINYFEDSVNMLSPISFAVTPDGKYIYVLGSGSNSISYFRFYSNNNSLEYLGYINFTNSGYSLEVSPCGKYVIVVTYENIEVYEINLNSGKLDYSSKKSCYDAALGSSNSHYISRDGANIYVSDGDSDSVDILKWDLNSRIVNVLTNIGSSYSNPMEFITSYDDKYLYLAYENGIAAFDRSINGNIHFSSSRSYNFAGLSAQSISLTPDNKYLYCITDADDVIYCYERDINSGSIGLRSQFNTGLTLLNCVRVSPDGQFVYFTGDDSVGWAERSENSSGLSNMNLFESSTAISIAYSLEFSPDGNIVYVIGNSSNTLAWFARE